MSALAYAGILPGPVVVQHEEEDIDGEEGFVAYEERFYFPAVESHSHSPFYYSYETGPIHVTMLGCYVDYSPNSDQAEWLKRDLASVDRLRTPWLIVGMHVSQFSPSEPPKVPQSYQTFVM